MSSGFLEKWSDVEDIWEHLLYSELGIEEGDNPIIITEIANSPKKHREKLAEVGPNLDTTINYTYYYYNTIHTYLIMIGHFTLGLFKVGVGVGVQVQNTGLCFTGTETNLSIY